MQRDALYKKGEQSYADVGSIEHKQKMEQGFKLFGKYYINLWD